jgi:hypothetical protein
MAVLVVGNAMQKEAEEKAKYESLFGVGVHCQNTRVYV